MRNAPILAGIGVLLLSATCLLTSASADPHDGGYHQRGHEVRYLPPRHREIRVSGHPYYYASGMFYQPSPQGYVVVSAPIGARVNMLPPGYISFGFGTSRYFYVNTTYYLWSNQTREYVVVEKPPGADAAVQTSMEMAQSAQVYVYPRMGQSEEQRDQDRYECHRWAKSETGYDPSLGGQNAGLAPDYRRALSACLEGRGYSVK